MKASVDYFKLGKDVCKNDNVLNVRVVKEESLRSFGCSDLWSASQVFCDELVFTEGDFNRVLVNAKLFLDDANFSGFIDCAMKYDNELESVAREVAVLARKYAELGIDFVEVR